MPVAVVGGGISGLTAAHALAKRGLSFVVLESSPRWGGVIRSEQVDGFLFEGGPDSLLAQKPEAIELCRELGLGERLIPTNPDQRNVFVLRGKQLHALPEGMVLAVPTRVGPFLRSRLFSWPGKARMGLDLLIPGKRDDTDESIAAFLRRRFGREAVERLGEPLLAGIHAGDPERLSILCTFPRFVALERRHGSLVRGMWALPRPAARSGPPPAAFLSLEGGLRELVEALVAALPADRLRAQCAVTSIHRAPGGYELHLAGGERVRARAVVVATPAHRSALLLETLQPRAAELLRGIPFVSTATVLLGYRREDVTHPLDGYGMVIPKTEGLRTSAFSFFSTKFPGRAAEGHVLLRAFLGGARDPGVLTVDDAGLVDLVQREMADVVGLRGRPAVSRVYRWPQGTPQMEVGHLQRMAELESVTAELPGLLLAGSGLRGTGIPDCVADAQRVAARAAEFVGTPPSP